MNRVFQGLYCDGGTTQVYYSQAVAMGQANSAMIEGCLISSTLSAGHPAVLTLEGSNDGQQWTDVLDTAGSPVPVSVDLGPSAPDYQQSSGQRCIIGFAQVRIRVDLTDTNKCVLDASIRTFQTA